MKEIVKTYEYSPITNGSLNIILPYIDNVESSNYRKYRGLHAGLDILAGSVRSLTLGVVILICKDGPNTFAVGVQYDKDNVFRYGHLDEVTIGIGDIVQSGQEVGVCKEYFHFEYATSERNDSPWPSYAGPMIYYKQNPEIALSGKVVFNNSPTVEVELDSDPNEQTIF